ncbi:MAG: RNA-guided pseudouridylation complex pseudouridine synthase subunit Cbf5 [Methanomicrobiales archaeon]|nr:RNA-guided pseudouridylation complex pseudouridine synthase subunit Cbf5 [Methanomicrobiales archaeon]
MTDTPATAKSPAVPDGIIIIDKPRGPTSHQVTAWARDIVGLHAGHSGTLDPMVSGVLVVMLGKAVRLAPFLLRHDKEYVCLMRLHGDAAEPAIRAVAEEFTGKLYQRPPRRSAVRRALRIRSVHAIEILDIKGRLVLFRVACDAGTYIRSLCHHMGLALGTGAHMQELRRTRSGAFSEAESCTLQDLLDARARADEGDPSLLQALVLPPERALTGAPQVTVRDSAIDAVCHGAVLAGVGILERSSFKKGELVAVFSERGELVCLGEALQGSAAFEPGDTGLVIAPRTVFMRPGTYPKGWTTHAGNRPGRSRSKKHSIKKTAGK